MNMLYVYSIDQNVLMDIMESSVIASVDTVDITQHATMLLEHVFLDVNLGIKHQTVQKVLDSC